MLAFSFRKGRFMPLFKNLQMLLFLISCALCNYGIAMDPPKKKDPPLFRIATDNNREIYILGSIHTLEESGLLSHPVMKELDKIAGKNAILYAEHETTNKVFLEYLKNNLSINSENHYVENLKIFKEGFEGMFKQIDILKNQIIEENNNIKDKEFYLDQKQEFGNIGNIKIFLDDKQESEGSFSEVLKADPWLCAAIIGTHANILY